MLLENLLISKTYIPRFNVSGLHTFDTPSVNDWTTSAVFIFVRAAGIGQVSKSPSFLSRKPLVEQSQDLGHVELYIFEVESFLIVLLHFEKIVQFKVKLE